MMSETRLPAFDLPDEFNALAIDEREYIVAEVGFIDSTLAPILSGMPAARAILIARSGRFSGEIRPRKARSRAQTTADEV
jgi:hypothetical protein